MVCIVKATSWLDLSHKMGHQWRSQDQYYFDKASHFCWLKSRKSTSANPYIYICTDDSSSSAHFVIKCNCSPYLELHPRQFKWVICNNNILQLYVEPGILGCIQAFFFGSRTMNPWLRYPNSEAGRPSSWPEFCACLVWMILMISLDVVSKGNHP